MSQTICTSVSSRDSTKMCPYQAQFTIFRVPACLLLLGVRCVCVCVCVVCSVWVCGCVCVCVLVCCSCFVVCFVVCLVVCGWCASLCVIVCRSGVSHTLSISRFSYTYLCACRCHSFCSFSHEKKYAVWNTYFP